MSIGTLTAVPVPPPRRVDRPVARAAMLLAPLAVLPLALASGLLAAAGIAVSAPPVLTAALVVGLLAWGSRGMHVDGLSDTADGLGASFDRARALEIMSRGDAGPMGVATLVIVLLAQAASLAALLAPSAPDTAPLAVVAIVCASRGALALACLHGVPSAKPDGLGALVAGSVGRGAGVLSAGVVVGLAVGGGVLAGRSWWLGLVAGIACCLVIAVWVRHCTRRLGGITGDVLGSCVEIALLVLAGVLAIPA
ncbi:adenosylcobinamide-GDP ribazoletransferase [Epidermidibacterium keratini]|uniref:Adenosylcobinamide-GDP ribazoletransferase n=1 Tax=Epidermidibacterium keratini TaxID=1891644 RepID=A0A7L4YUV6_9ACTN|nr:adenosylcobinamide-GDP ribazoletransferase [Epidermidibacterium keratini]